MRPFQSGFYPHPFTSSFLSDHRRPYISRLLPVCAPLTDLCLQHLPLQGALKPLAAMTTSYLPNTQHTTSPPSVLQDPYLGRPFSRQQAPPLALWGGGWGGINLHPTSLTPDFFFSKSTPVPNHVEVCESGSHKLTLKPNPPTWRVKNQGP